MKRYEVLIRGIDGEWKQKAITELSPDKIRLKFPMLDHWVLYRDDTVLKGYMAGVYKSFVKVIQYDGDYVGTFWNS